MCHIKLNLGPQQCATNSLKWRNLHPVDQSLNVSDLMRKVIIRRTNQRELLVNHRSNQPHTQRATWHAQLYRDRGTVQCFDCGRPKCNPSIRSNSDRTLGHGRCVRCSRTDLGPQRHRCLRGIQCPFPCPFTFLPGISRRMPRRGQNCHFSSRSARGRDCRRARIGLPCWCLMSVSVSVLP